MIEAEASFMTSSFHRLKCSPPNLSLDIDGKVTQPFAFFPIRVAAASGDNQHKMPPVMPTTSRDHRVRASPNMSDMRPLTIPAERVSIAWLLRRLALQPPYRGHKASLRSSNADL